MLLRSAFVALVLLGAAAAATAEPRRGSAAAERAPATAARIRTDTPTRRPPVVAGPTILEAENSFRCANGTTYTLSVDGGRCEPDRLMLPNGEMVTRGMICTNDSGDSSTASCVAGCGDTTGSGKCNIK